MILHSGHSNFKMTFLYIEFKINDYHGKQCGCNKHKNHCVFFILRSYINNYNQRIILFNYIH